MLQAIDLETTGLPSEEGNKTKITELSMVAVFREHLLETRPGCSPRVLDKLTICVNPQKLVSPESSNTTGLDNDLLQYKSPFNRDVCFMIQGFLNVQPKPVCLIAQNGMGFDFPILKNHLEKNKVVLSEDVMCADCYHGFYDILEKKEELMEMLSLRVGDGSSSSVNSSTNERLNNTSRNLRNPKVKINLSTIFSELPVKNYVTETCSAQNHVENDHESVEIATKDAMPNVLASPNATALEITSDKSINDDLNELDIHARNKMKLQNETTPKRQTKYLQRKKSIGEIRNRRYPWSDNNRPKKSYKLAHIYERVLNRQAQEAHRAENDCIYAIEIAVAIGEEFVSWVDENCCPFTEIKPMTIGVRIGF